MRQWLINMSECNKDCAGCGVENCESRQGLQKAKLNDRSSIKKIIGVLSGKGGVGKSFVTSSLAVSLAKQGHKVGILDSDVTGPSIPKSFGLHDRCMGEDSLIYPIETKLGIKIISANLLLENEGDPILWRGPLLGNLIRQFYEDVLWEELDYLLIDMPPGTGDVALSVFQLLPVDEIIIVTSPQDLVSLIVTKALKMAKMMNIKVLGVVENMSYLICPDCQKHINVFGDSHLESLAKEMNFEILGRLPLIPENSKKVDDGKVEDINLPEIDEIAKKL